jgi:8-oxo-dGTP pyrophosphatase MutT (NUDIX family)
MHKTTHDSETSANGQQVITACAFIFKVVDNEPLLFLPRRASTKKFLPNKYELPGGHLNFGETLDDGLKREIQEEFNMNIQLGKCFYAFTYLNNIKGSHSVEVIYYARFTSPETDIKLNPEDHSEYQWVSLDQYIKLVLDNEDDEYKAILEGFANISF